MKYTDAKVRKLCQKYLGQGYTAFKIKVGQDIDKDLARCKLIRDQIGWSNILVSHSILIRIFRDKLFVCLS